MTRTRSMILSTVLAVLLTSTAVLAGGEDCDGKKQVNKTRDKTSCPAEAARQVRSTQKNEAATAAKPSADGKSCDHARKKQSKTVSAETKAGDKGKKCEKRTKSKKISGMFCTDEDCEYCSGKEDRISARHMKKLVDDTLAPLDRTNKKTVNRKELRSKLQVLRRHLEKKRKQLASDDAGTR